MRKKIFLGMKMFVAMPHSMVVRICCSGPEHRTLRALGMHGLVCMPHEMVVWVCCSGPDHVVLLSIADPETEQRSFNLINTASIFRSALYSFFT